MIPFTLPWMLWKLPWKSKRWNFPMEAMERSMRRRASCHMAEASTNSMEASTRLDGSGGSFRGSGGRFHGNSRSFHGINWNLPKWKLPWTLPEPLLKRLWNMLPRTLPWKLRKLPWKSNRWKSPHGGHGTVHERRARCHMAEASTILMEASTRLDGSGGSFRGSGGSFHGSKRSFRACFHGINWKLPNGSTASMVASAEYASIDASMKIVGAYLEVKAMECSTRRPWGGP